MSKKINWDRARARQLAKEYMELPQTGTFTDQKRWYKEIGHFIGIAKIDPIAHKRWVDDRKQADALRAFLKEIKLVHNFLEANAKELQTCPLLGILFKDYQNALRQFLNNSSDFKFDEFPEIVHAIGFFRLRQLARFSRLQRKIFWGVEPQ
jgi:hypothetical protein